MSDQKKSRPSIQIHFEGSEEENEFGWPDGLCIVKIYDDDEVYYKVAFRWEGTPYWVPYQFGRASDAARALSVLASLGIEGKNLEDARSIIHEKVGVPNVKQRILESMQW